MTTLSPRGNLSTIMQRRFASLFYRRRLAIVLAYVVAFFMGTSAFAASTAQLKTATGSGVLVSADTMYRDADRQIIELKGNVQLIYDEQYTSCDHAVIDLLHQTVLAEGHLVMSSPQAYVEGDSANLSYKDNTGVIQNGYVKSGQVIVQGAQVKKLSADEYEADDAKFTACTTCPTAWTFSGTRIHAQIGGYAYIKHSILEVANVPVLWLPYLIVPLKSERQTGLLMPSLDYQGKGGIGATVPFFWAISRSQDALFTFKNYANRGQKGMIDYRYMLSDKSYGELNSAYMHDQIFDGDPVFAGQPIGSHANRFFLTYDHVLDLPNGFVQKTDLNIVSDIRYPRDFPDEMTGQADPALENRVSLTRNTEKTHASLDTDYYINQLESNPIQSNEDSVHRWPELRYSLTERRLADNGIFSNMLFSFDANYVNFAREGIGYDDVYALPNGQKCINRGHQTNVSSNGDPVYGTCSGVDTGAGQFNPGTDIIRSGQRLDLLPEVSYPFSVGPYLDVLPAVQFRHTQYSFNVNTPDNVDYDSTPYRQYLRGTLSLRTRFSRIYGRPDTAGAQPILAAPPDSPSSWIDNESRSTTDLVPPPSVPIVHPTLWRHEVEPEVTFVGSPYLKQTQNSFFGPEVPLFLADQPISDVDFQTAGAGGNGVQFDYYDRFINRNSAGFFLTNRLVRKSWINGEPTYKQVASLKVGQSYDFDEATYQPGPRFPWTDISALLDVRLDHFETNTLVRHFPYHNQTNTSSRAKIMDDHGRYLQLSFSQVFLITRNVADAYAGRSEDVGFSLGFDSRYVGLAATIDYKPNGFSPLDLQVMSWGTEFRFKPPGNCWGIKAMIAQPLGSDLVWHLDFDYQFGGAPPPPVQGA